MLVQALGGREKPLKKRDNNLNGWEDLPFSAGRLTASQIGLEARYKVQKDKSATLQHEILERRDYLEELIMKHARILYENNFILLFFTGFFAVNNV